MKKIYAIIMHEGEMAIPSGVTITNQETIDMVSEQIIPGMPIPEYAELPEYVSTSGNQKYMVLPRTLGITTDEMIYFINCILTEGENKSNTYITLCDKDYFTKVVTSPNNIVCSAQLVQDGHYIVANKERLISSLLKSVKIGPDTKISLPMNMPKEYTLSQFEDKSLEEIVEQILIETIGILDPQLEPQKVDMEQEENPIQYDTIAGEMGEFNEKNVSEHEEEYKDFVDAIDEVIGNSEDKIPTVE